MSVLTPIITCA